MMTMNDLWKGFGLWFMIFSACWTAIRLYNLLSGYAAA